MAEGVTIGSLIVRIGADAEDLLRDLKKADSGFGSFGKNVKLAHGAVTAFASAAAAAGATLAAVLVMTAKSADAMVKMAQAAGMATDEFSQLAYAAQLSGVSAEALSSSVSRLNRNISDAAQGTGEAGKAFTALGLQTQNVDGSLKSADQVIAEVANKFATFADGPEKSALAIALFGRAGAQMIPLLNQSAAGIAQLREEAKALGVSIDSETGKAAERFNDNLERLQQAGHGVANRLMAELLPALEVVTDRIVNAAKSSGQLRDDLEGLSDFIQSATLTVFQTLAVVGSDLAFTFKTIGGELGVIAAQLTRLAHGDVKGARLIGEEWTKDAAQARKDLDEFQARIMKLGIIKQTPTDQFFDFTPHEPKGAAPKMEDNKGGFDLAKQLQEGVDEENRIQAEALAATVKYQDAQLTEDKAHVDARMQVLYDFYQAEQDLAVAQGQILLENDSLSHSSRLDQLIAANDAEYAENERYRLAVQDLEQNFSDAELQALGGMHAVKEQMEQQHQQRLLQIRSQSLNTAAQFVRASYAQQAATIFGELANITAGVAQHNRQLFELNKVAGIANAVIAAYEGISLTMSKYPFPLNIAMAAAHAAAAFAQVSAIQSTTFGGAAAPSVGPTAAPPVTPVAGAGTESGGGQGGPTTIVQLPGTDFLSTKTVRDLMKRIEEETRNGGRVIVA